MPPHARMSLTQQLLLRALVARFWQRAVRARRASRAGAPSCTTASCCRTSSEQDLDDVHRRAERRRLSAASPSGSRRTSSSAFPRIGDFAARGVEVELRQALEPWHVMGEEGAAGGTVRYVDSSVERAAGEGRRASRPIATCSPATADECRCSRPARVGEFVAGVRYRAWQPPSALHPTIGVACAADLRPGRHLDEPLAGRLPVPRRASGRPQLRHLPGQRLRGREPPPGALLPNGPHAGARRTVAARAPNLEFPFTLDLRKV